MAAAHDITEAAFPFTREGHRKLLAKANALKRASKHAWSMFFEQMETVQELRENLEDIREPLGTAAANLPPQVAQTLDETLKKFQQLAQQLGRSCECPVCYKAVKASETNPEHESFMKLLYCGHLLCGDCAATMKESEDKRCPVCRTDIATQIANVVPAKAGAQSKPRPKRDADDLLQTPKDDQPLPEGAYITRYKGDCYACDASWTAGATVAKHRRLQTKQVCVGCADAVVPCTICGSDASETDALRNGKKELKRFFCLPCVREMQEQGKARAIVGATQFLNKNKQ